MTFEKLRESFSHISVQTREIYEAQSKFARVVWCVFHLLCVCGLVWAIVGLATPFASHVTVASMKRQDNTKGMSLPVLMISLAAPVSSRLLKVLGPKYEALVPYFYSMFENPYFMDRVVEPQASELLELFSEFLSEPMWSSSEFELESFMQEYATLNSTEIFEGCAFATGPFVDCSEIFQILHMGFVYHYQSIVLNPRPDFSKQRIPGLYGVIQIRLSRPDLNVSLIPGIDRTSFDVVFRRTKLDTDLIPRYRFKRDVELGKAHVFPIRLSETNLTFAAENCRKDTDHEKLADMVRNEQTVCVQRCRIEASWRRCGCIRAGAKPVYIIEAENDWKVCNVSSNFSCFEHVNDEVSEDMKRCVSTCEQPCVYYEFSAPYENTRKTGRDDLAMLEYYFEDFSIWLVEFTPQVSATQLLTNIGAALAFWIGVKLDHIFRIIFYSAHALWHVMCNKKE